MFHIKAITVSFFRTVTTSFLGGQDGCSYMDKKEKAWRFKSYENAQKHLEENFDVSKDSDSHKHNISIIPTRFFIDDDTNVIKRRISTRTNTDVQVIQTVILSKNV